MLGNQKKTNWIKAGKHALIQRMTMLLFGVGTFYLLVRTLEQEIYGTWMLFFSVASLIQIAREGILKKPLIRYLNDLEGTDRLKLQASSLQINMTFSVISSTLVLVASSFLSRIWEAPGLEILFAIYFFTNLATTLISHCTNLLEARFRFKGPMISHILKSASFFLCIAYFFWSKTPLNVMLLGLCYLSTTLLATGVLMAFSRDLFGLKFYFSREWIVKLLAYGKYTLGTNIGATILRNTDIWMIGYYISPAAVAVYNVAIRIANLFEIPTMAMGSILFPQAVKKAESEGEGAFRELYEKSLTIILLLVAPLVIIVIIFSNDIVYLLAGERYAQAGWILNVTMLYGLLVPFSKQMGILLDAVGKAKLNMLFVFRNTLINVVLNAIYIPYFGTIGAAYATLNSLLIMLVIDQIYLKRNFGVRLINLLHYTRYFFLRVKKMVGLQRG